MQRHEMIDAMRGLGLKGMAGAFDEAVTTGLQRVTATGPSQLTGSVEAQVMTRFPP